MIDPVTVGAVLGSLNKAVELTSKLIGLKNSGAIAEQVQSLNAVLLAAQKDALATYQAYSSLIDEKRQLEARIANLEAWDAKEEQYELVHLHPGSFAFAEKERTSGTKPVHYLCATCFNNRKVSILQGWTTGYGLRELHCTTCGEKIIHSDGGQPLRQPTDWTPV
jgi:DNA-directed RNA polymerase subunit RPC12/RpoP